MELDLQNIDVVTKKVIGLCYWDDAKTKVDKSVYWKMLWRRREDTEITAVCVECSPQKKSAIFIVDHEE